jgi:hypothetical protein
MGIRISRSRLKEGPLKGFTWLGAFFTLSCGLVHVHPDAYPWRLTPEEAAVQIYFKEQKIPCEYLELGNIQAASGEELEKDEEQEEYATFEAAVAWLKKEAHNRGATGVIVYDRKQSPDKATYFVTGVAIRCVVK